MVLVVLDFRIYDSENDCCRNNYRYFLSIIIVKFYLHLGHSRALVDLTLGGGTGAADADLRLATRGSAGNTVGVNLVALVGRDGRAGSGHALHRSTALSGSTGRSLGGGTSRGTSGRFTGSRASHSFFC